MDIVHVFCLKSQTRTDSESNARPLQRDRFLIT